MALARKRHSPAKAYWYLNRKRRLNLTPGGPLPDGGYWIVDDGPLYLATDDGEYLTFEV